MERTLYLFSCGYRALKNIVGVIKSFPLLFLLDIISPGSFIIYYASFSYLFNILKCSLILKDKNLSCISRAKATTEDENRITRSGKKSKFNRNQ